MTKTITAVLIAAAFALPISFAVAAPQHGAGGHTPPSAPSTHMNQDMHGDAVSDAAKAAKADDTNVGKAVSQVASDKNQDAHGDAVSNAAHEAKANDTNVGKAVSPVANDKNKGKHEAKGHSKTHHHHH